MKTILSLRMLYAGLLLMLTACQAADESPRDAMVKPGDTVAGMRLATGAKDAPPLWAFCSPSQQSTNTITVNCSVRVLTKLGIGDLLKLAGGRINDVDWSTFNWQLLIDDQSLDLEAFGTFDYRMPAMPQKPSPLREVFQKFTAWDVVLTNLIPGQHTLHGFVHTKLDSYTWLIHLTIKADTVPTRIPWVICPNDLFHYLC